MRKTLANLLTDPKYKLKMVERQFGYFSSKFGVLAVPYFGVYGKGYRVYIENKKIKQGGKSQMTIYYFIEREESDE